MVEVLVEFNYFSSCDRGKGIMHRLICLVALLISFARTCLAADEALRSRVSADLKRYCQERLRQPFIITDETPAVKVGLPWEVPIKQLSAAKPEDRKKAADYLLELVGRQVAVSMPASSCQRARGGQGPLQAASRQGSGTVRC